MISPRLFMTNQHVIKTAMDARDLKAQFAYETSTTGQDLVSVDVRFDPDEFFWCSPKHELDVSIVAVDIRAADNIVRFGWAPLSSALDKHAIGDFVTVIQHPGGARKQVALRENRILGRGKKGITLHYSADTVSGSSGSPVYNDQLDLIALHHAWGGDNEKEYEDGTAVPDASNEGIRISSIVEALRVVHDSLPEAPRMLLAEALNPPTTTAIQASVTVAAAASGVASAGPATQSGGGAPVVSGHIEASGASSGSGRATRPDPDYSNRAGYDRDFLGIRVSLPRMSAAELAECAPLLSTKARQDPHRLDYHHFSAVVHRDRRLPAFTAVNIDGAASRSINRDTGQIEASETWYTDPRIDPSHQLEQAFYDDQVPFIIDRGHMVRRLDPAWGDDNSAFDAALDTFHFSNCCPQVGAFNRHLWLSIEDFALENARTARKKITVFSGPAFTDTDPKFRKLPIPRKFWKVVVRVDKRALRTTAFIADQGPHVDRLLAEGQIESFDDLGVVAVYNRPLREVAQMSKLRFVGLHKSDTYDGHLESAGAISDPSEASW